jgi:tRNA-Thr(GGU) m(6)t(6)A37 methyltransferase TsaA
MTNNRPGSIHILNSIGVIRTPYINNAPYQPVKDVKGEFRIVLKKEFTEGLKQLASFKYIFVVFYLDKIIRSKLLTVKPDWAEGIEVGVFASRSPDRPNPIGISIVQIKKIEGNVIRISGMDAFDMTPVLDIKPYLSELDSKDDANLGWVDSLDDKEHLALHIKGIPH